MLYPNIQDMTNEKVNRYALVIAAAKCARSITERTSAEHEHSDDRKDSSERFPADRAAMSEKSVTVAIDMINSGECRIITD